MGKEQDLSGQRRVRLGIDVGGTFTDAVAVDGDTYEVIGVRKVPTTHAAEEGVSAGILQVVRALLEEHAIGPEEVSFIAHGTTQATNALLEGDVVPVGVVSAGSGVEGRRVRGDTEVGTIELAPGKELSSTHAHVDASGSEATLEAEIERLLAGSAEVVVAATAFSVDDPEDELRLMELCRRHGALATGTHEISKLYGLKMRTTTAVINASILPRMMQTADMTERAVEQMGIPAPLMIMRCDGGVMTVNEVRKRPILTMLSGPAAGVAGALMYEKVSNGVFLEVGGTSTDASCVKDGKVMVEYAQVGRHKTYLNSLDVRTVGIAGGSMVRISRPAGKEASLEDVGPRSAHIAGLPYAVFAEPEDMVDPELEFVRPDPTDPQDYVAVSCSNGKRFALTLACAANLAGYVGEDDYARGNVESARGAFEPLASAMSCAPEDAARQVLARAAEKVEPVVRALLDRYELDAENALLVGGGGGSSVVVPFLAEKMGLPYRSARNAEVISTIGVALAMVREVVERTIPNPTDDDILRLRAEAEEAVLRAGATEGTAEIQVEVDSQRNIVRAVATGATELRTRDLLKRELSEEELEESAAKSMRAEPGAVGVLTRVGRWTVFAAEKKEKKLFGLFSGKTRVLSVLDAEGVVRLHKKGGAVKTAPASQVAARLGREVDDQTSYGDAGSFPPETYLLHGEKLSDLSGLQTKAQILSMADLELRGVEEDAPVAILTFKKT